jgi:hypothetical protein
MRIKRAKAESESVNKIKIFRSAYSSDAARLHNNLGDQVIKFAINLI